MKARPILFATDFSPASGAALRQALALARTEGATLLVAHVVEPPVPFAPDGYVLPQIYDDLAAAQRRGAEERMRRILARARRDGVAARGLLLRGAPHEAIARTARGHRAGRVVVGTHGRRGFRRLFLGSVAARVVASSPCPVLVVPARRERRTR
ncbi:MAG TPA: universal stress protein [Thermoanaerobaculia bacterium]